MNNKEMASVLEEIGLAQQHKRNSAQTGLKALMVAVLENAIRSYLSGNNLRQRDAEWWIDNPDRTNPFSFVVICETLALDPSAAKKALHRMADSKRKYRHRSSRTLYVVNRNRP